MQHEEDKQNPCVISGNNATVTTVDEGYDDNEENECKTRRRMTKGTPNTV